jgi:hypothetical protein
MLTYADVPGAAIALHRSCMPTQMHQLMDSHHEIDHAFQSEAGVISAAAAALSVHHQQPKQQLLQQDKQREKQQGDMISTGTILDVQQQQQQEQKQQQNAVAELSTAAISTQLQPWHHLPQLQQLQQPPAALHALPLQPLKRQPRAPALDLSRVRMGSSAPVCNLSDAELTAVSTRCLEREAELCFEAGSVRTGQLHPNALLQDSRCYVYRAVGRQVRGKCCMTQCMTQCAGLPLCTKQARSCCTR